MRKVQMVTQDKNINTNRLSYDGMIFHNQASSKHEHYRTTLANIDGAPLIIGGSEPKSKKAEILDISSNSWTEIDDYPYHE